MTRINIPVPEKLHQRLRLRAVHDRKTIKETVIGILEEGA